MCTTANSFSTVARLLNVQVTKDFSVPSPLGEGVLSEREECGRYPNNSSYNIFIIFHLQ